MVGFSLQQAQKYVTMYVSVNPKTLKSLVSAMGVCLINVLQKRCWGSLGCGEINLYITS